MPGRKPVFNSSTLKHPHMYLYAYIHLYTYTETERCIDIYLLDLLEIKMILNLRHCPQKEGKDVIKLNLSPFNSIDEGFFFFNGSSLVLLSSEIFFCTPQSSQKSWNFQLFSCPFTTHQPHLV